MARAARKPTTQRYMDIPYEAANDNSQLEYDSPNNYLAAPPEMQAANDNQPEDNNRGSIRRTRQMLAARKRGLKGLASTGVSTTFDREMMVARAAFSGWIIVAVVTPIWLLQFNLWLISVGAAVLGSTPIIKWFVPAESVFYIFSIIGVFLGWMSMIAAVAIYLARGVDFFSGWKGLIFAVLVGLGSFPLLTFVPWVYIYCILVTILQTGEKEEEE